MERLVEFRESCLIGAEWLAGMAVAFGILAWLMPCNRGMYWWKDLRGFATDLVYWFFMPLVFRNGRTLLLWGAVLLMFGGREPQFLPVQHWPLWQQCVAVLLIQDVILYWIHRAFHGRLAWKFHAVHHSPRVLDWISTTRFHPVNSLLEFAVADVVVVLMGFSPASVMALAPFNLAYSAMVHANLNWTFGPLRHVFASPVFHRWHHTTREEGLNKNFAPTFPILDVIFGTFYMPAGRVPENFGIGDSQFPQGFWGQMLYPFDDRRTSTVQGAASPPLLKKIGATRPVERANELQVAKRD
jgi:sterol desaturase/sphingolipid hydroxylase (fatty acid hydroxylase superfamily)